MVRKRFFRSQKTWKYQAFELFLVKWSRHDPHSIKAHDFTIVQNTYSRATFLVKKFTKEGGFFRAYQICY
jgi:hypothetical protein